MMSQLLEIRNQFEELQKKFEDYLPKVDPDLIYDLLTRQREDPLITLMYILEVLTKRGIDLQKAGAVQGYVGGPRGLPAIGSTVIAHKIQVLPGTDQRFPDYRANSIISIDGKYSFSLPPGVYSFTVAFPDGRNQMVKNYAVWPESVHTLNFKY